MGLKFGDIAAEQDNTEMTAHFIYELSTHLLLYFLFESPSIPWRKWLNHNNDLTLVGK